MTLVEEMQADAARRIVEAVAQLTEAEANVRAAIAAGRDVDLSVNRMAQIAGRARTTVYRWLRDVDSQEADAAPTAAPSRRRGQSTRGT